MPGWLRSSLCLLVLAAHFLVVGTAALGAAGAFRARGKPGGDDAREALVATAWALTLYHLAAAGALIGLSRFRVPLIPLWLPFSALLLVRPRAILATAFDGPRRSLFAAALLALVLALSLVYLGRAFPVQGPLRCLLREICEARAGHGRIAG